MQAPIEIVHSDICGPMKISSMGGCNYFVSFIDDFTRKTWVYYLKHKYDAFRCFSVDQGTRGDVKRRKHQNINDGKRR